MPSKSKSLVAWVRANQKSVAKFVGLQDCLIVPSSFVKFGLITSTSKFPSSSINASNFRKSGMVFDEIVIKYSVSTWLIKSLSFWFCEVVAGKTKWATFDCWQDFFRPSCCERSRLSAVRILIFPPKLCLRSEKNFSESAEFLESCKLL